MLDVHTDMDVFDKELVGLDRQALHEAGTVVVRDHVVDDSGLGDHAAGTDLSTRALASAQTANAGVFYAALIIARGERVGSGAGLPVAS